jgi:hypothetical protein
LCNIELGWISGGF